MNTLEKMERYASIELKQIPEDEVNVRIDVKMVGSMNALLNAYKNITIKLLEKVIADVGKEEAMMLYGVVQTNALLALGIDPEEEVEKIEQQAKDEFESLLEELLGSLYEDEEEEEEELI